MRLFWLLLLWLLLWLPPPLPPPRITLAAVFISWGRRIDAISELHWPTVYSGIEWGVGPTVIETRLGIIVDNASSSLMTRSEKVVFVVSAINIFFAPTMMTAL